MSDLIRMKTQAGKVVLDKGGYVEAVKASAHNKYALTMRTTPSVHATWNVNPQDNNYRASEVLHRYVYRQKNASSGGGGTASSLRVFVFKATYNYTDCEVN